MEKSIDGNSFELTFSISILFPVGKIATDFSQQPSKLSDARGGGRIASPNGHVKDKKILSSIDSNEEWIKTELI